MSGCCVPSRPDESESSATDGTPPGSHTDVGAPAGIELVDIPGGTFAMGTDDPQGYPDDGEGPVHEVTLSAYRLGVHTVTNDDFAAFVDATGYRTTAEQFGTRSCSAGCCRTTSHRRAQSPPHPGGAR